jgi:hypothetical protein
MIDQGSVTPTLCAAGFNAALVSGGTYLLLASRHGDDHEALVLAPTYDSISIMSMRHNTLIETFTSLELLIGYLTTRYVLEA